MVLIRKISLLFFLGILLLVPSTSFAQLEQNDISVISDPEIPGPYEGVVVTLQSYTYDLDQALITWKTNGQVTLTGIGEKSFSFQTKGIGEATTIEVTIAIDGEKIVKRITTKPGAVDLLWQAVDSYTPPFYKGKALPSSEGLVKIVALPNFNTNGKITSSKNTLYAWKRNYTALPGLSGYGKQSITIKMNYLSNQENISLESTDPNDGSNAKANIALRTFNPKIIFYERDSVLGTKYNAALTQGVTISESDKMIVAEPYFVSPNYPLSGDLNYTWSINGNTIPTPERKNAIILRRGEQTGIATLKIDITSVSKLFLEVSKSLNIRLE